MKKLSIKKKIPAYVDGIAANTTGFMGENENAILGTAESMAAFGNSIVPGWGALAGGVVGLGIGSLLPDKIKEAKDRKLRAAKFNERNAAAADMQQEWDEYNQTGLTYASGGAVPVVKYFANKKNNPGISGDIYAPANESASKYFKSKTKKNVAAKIATNELGGSSSGQLSWVNGKKGEQEVIKYPNGETKRVKSKGGKTDDVLTSLPEGAVVFGGLSNGGKTFAQRAMKIHNANKKAERDGGRYAKKSIELNNAALDRMAQEQEELKLINGIGQKYKGISTYTTGGIKPPALDPIRQVNLPAGMSSNPAFSNSNSNPGTGSTGTGSTGTGSTGTGSTGNNWMVTLGSALPSALNIVRGLQGPETTEPVTNQYARPALRKLSTRTNDRAIREANRRNTAIANYNAKQFTGTGQNMAFRLANNAMNTSAMYDAMANMQNINNTQAANYAQAALGIGAQDAAALNMANDINMRNKAAADNMVGAGVSQLSQLAQITNKDRNMSAQDQKMLQLLKQSGIYDYMMKGNYGG